MKKAILFMLATLCISAVQAVTATWTGNTGVTGLFSYGASSKHSLVATFSATGTGVLFLAGQEQNYTRYDNKKNSIRIERDAEGTITLIVKGGTGTNLETSLILAENVAINEEHKVAYAFNRLANGTTSNLDVYFDGEKITTLSINTEGINKWNGPVNGIMQTENATFDFAVYDNVLLSEAEGVALTTPKANTDVPEPTALALLALGVAGLALKRKVA